MKMKIKYNELLKRQKKAELYLNNPNIDMKTILYKYSPEYQRIIVKLSALIFCLEMTDDEISNGFKL